MLMDMFKVTKQRNSETKICHSYAPGYAMDRGTQHICHHSSYQCRVLVIIYCSNAIQLLFFSPKPYTQPTLRRVSLVKIWDLTIGHGDSVYKHLL